MSTGLPNGYGPATYRHGLPFCTGPATTDTACQLAQGLPPSRGPAILHRACQLATGLPYCTGPATYQGPATYRQGPAKSPRFCYYAGLLLNKRTKFPSSGPSCGYMYPVASCHYYELVLARVHRHLTWNHQD
jgi:hypothetical protein